MASILKYFKLAKPANDHLPDPEGTLSSKLPSSAIASANLEVRSVIDSDRHPPFSNTPHVAFKRKNYYRSHGEICQTFFRQIGFFADLPNFNPSKLSLFTVRDRSSSQFQPIITQKLYMAPLSPNLHN